MHERKIDKVKHIIEKSLKEWRTIPEICKEYGKSERYVRRYVREDMFEQLEKGNVSSDETDEVERLYEDYKENLPDIKNSKKSGNKGPNKKDGPEEENKVGENVDNTVLTDEEKREIEYDAYQDDKFDERSYGEPIRDEGDVFEDRNGNEIKRIKGYKYHIKIRDEEDLKGELTREEMDMIYRLYSSMDGAGLTIRSVSRYFPSLTYRDFKRLLRAFNITKASIPVAPHVLEEKSEDEVMKYIMRNKENNVLKKLENDRNKFVEKQLRETQKELLDLKYKNSEIEKAIKDVVIEGDIEPFYIKQKEVDENRALFLYLSDQHVGAETEEDSLYDNYYDKDEFERRLNKTLEEVQEISSIYGVFDEIVVCNLGDSLDGYNEFTTRGGHQLSQNMNNKEQYNVFVNAMVKFFDSLHNMDAANNISYYSVSDSNHDGDFGYVANKTLEHIFSLKYPGMNVRVFEKFIDHIMYGDHAFLLCHGKDKEDMKKGFPLTLDHKTENFFNDYIDRNKILVPNIHVVMGDLHQSSLQFGKRFRYKRTLSMYGSSKYIHTNFGSGQAGVEYDIVYKNDNKVREGRIFF